MSYVVVVLLRKDIQENFSPKRERSSSLLQEEPEPPQIKEEPEELQLQRPEEPDGSPLTSLAVKSEDEDISAHIEVELEADTEDDDFQQESSEADTEDSDYYQEESSGGQSSLNTGTENTYLRKK